MLAVEEEGHDDLTLHLLNKTAAPTAFVSLGTPPKRVTTALETTAGRGETTVETRQRRRWPSNSVGKVGEEEGEEGEEGGAGGAKRFNFKHTRNRAVVLYDFTALHDTGHDIVRRNAPVLNRRLY